MGMLNFFFRSAVVSVLTAIIISSPAYAALDYKSYVTGNGSTVLLVSGNFETNEPVERFLSEIARKSPDIVTFDSPGGSIYAAFELGRLIRRSGVPTIQTRTTQCDSACALAFLGGQVRFAEAGSIGVHKSSFAPSAEMDGNSAASAMQSVTADIIDYLVEMDVKPELLSFAFRYEPWDMRHLSLGEMLELGVVTDPRMPDGLSILPQRESVRDTGARTLPERPSPEIAKDNNSPGVGTVFTEIEGGPEMVVVPSGSLASQRGNVYFDKPFAVGRYEVTFGQWRMCVSQGGCRGYFPNDLGLRNDSLPAFNISYDDALSFVNWLSRKTGKSYRIPTESEWEYAASAGSSVEARPVVSSDYERNRLSDGGPRPVGYSGPNGFGLFDMIGNLNEWVADCWMAKPAYPSNGSPVVNGECASHPLRGGGWTFRSQDLRIGARTVSPSNHRWKGNGFRVLRSF